MSCRLATLGSTKILTNTPTRNQTAEAKQNRLQAQNRKGLTQGTKKQLFETKSRQCADKDNSDTISDDDDEMISLESDDDVQSDDEIIEGDFCRLWRY